MGVQIAVVQETHNSLADAELLSRYRSSGGGSVMVGAEMAYRSEAERAAMVSWRASR